MIKVSSVVVDEYGNTFSVVKNEGGSLTLRSVATKEVYVGVPEAEVTVQPGVTERA